MNERMWEHPTLKENLEILKSYSYKIIGTAIVEMGGGEYGEGKYCETGQKVINVETSKDLIKQTQKNLTEQEYIY